MTESHEVHATGPQLAQAAPASAPAISITVTQNGATQTHSLLPGTSLTVEPGASVTVDAAGLVLDVTVSDGDIVFTNPDTGETYALAGMAELMTADTARLGLFNNTTGAVDEVAVEDVLAGIQTAAGGGADSGGFSTANQF